MRTCVAHDALGDGPLAAPLETRIAGVFGMGDVRTGSVKHMCGAIGDGAAAVAQIHQTLGAAAAAATRTAKR